MSAERKLSDVMAFDSEGQLIANPDSPWQRYLNYYADQTETGAKPMGYQEWAKENNEPLEIA
jgi:hypothetical protein